jgi:CysZ protein
MLIEATLKTLRDITRRDILWQALWPPLLSFFAWTGIAILAWMPMSRWLLANMPEWSWLDWLGPYLVHAVLLLIFAPLIYMTTVMLVATFSLPRMMTIVAARDYPDLTRYGSASAAFWGSLGNTVVTGVIFVVGWLITLPLLLIPGVLLVLPLLWTAWLNQRTFRFDVLAEHATADERTLLFGRKRSNFWGAGFVSAAAAHVPLANVMAPAFGALLFVHVGLSALREMRNREGIVVSSRS